jgi:hypothetical protein
MGRNSFSHSINIELYEPYMHNTNYNVVYFSCSVSGRRSASDLSVALGTTRHSDLVLCHKIDLLGFIFKTCYLICIIAIPPALPIPPRLLRSRKPQMPRSTPMLADGFTTSLPLLMKSARGTSSYITASHYLTH